MFALRLHYAEDEAKLKVSTGKEAELTAKLEKTKKSKEGLRE